MKLFSGRSGSDSARVLAIRLSANWIEERGSQLPGRRIETLDEIGALSGAESAATTWVPRQ